MLADSSDDSGSDLNLSVLDIGGISSASESDVEGATFQHQLRLSQHFRQQAMACHLVMVVVDGWGANATMGQTGKRRKHVPISGNSSDENNDTGDWATIADISTDVEPDRQELLGSMHTCLCT